MRYLILSVDYEIFGNGAGDVRHHMVEPVERMARVCEKHQMPLTVFFEAEEYAAFERHAPQLRQMLSYDPAGLIREQVSALVRRGHDFQLHLHPQWHGATYESGRWRLRQEQATVDHLFETVEETAAYLGERKRLLEELRAGAARPDPVLAYRAGAFSARPGQRLLAAMVENGFEIESSVVRGLHQPGADYSLDYRDVAIPARMWRVESDVGREAADGPIWEIPIHSELRRRCAQVTWRRLRAKFANHVPQEQRRNNVERFLDPRHPLQVMRSLWEPAPVKLDFHNLSSRQMLRMIRAVDSSPERGPVDVLVLIGHSKEHVEDQTLERFLAAVAADPALRVTTFAEIARLLRARPAGLGAAMARGECR